MIKFIKRHSSGIFLVMVMVAAISLFGCTKGAHDGHSDKQNSEGDQKKAATYVCPMHPQITSDKPGTCPICGMDLVPVETDEGSGDHSGHQQNSPAKKVDEDGWEDVGGDGDSEASTPIEPAGHTHFKLSLDKEQKIGVKTDVVKTRSLFKSIRAPGRIAFDPELYTAQSEYLEAIRQWARVKDSPIEEVKRSTREMINSAKIRLQVLGLSAGQIQELGRKGSQSEGLLLTGKGQENWIYADVFEVDLPHIKKDLSVEVTANFLQGKKLYGKVVSVDEVINANTRTAKVRIKLNESHESIRPESYVNVSIMAPLGKHLTVPVDALMDTGRETYVFISKGEGRFEPRAVAPIRETEDYIALASGVKEGESVVVGGNFMLDSESRLKAVIKGMASGQTHNH